MHNFSKKTALVTGGAGFLGSHLCERLLLEGYEVLCLDNFYTGSKANISELMKNPNFELLRHDVKENITLEVDEIYNLACAASPVHYQRYPIETTQASVMGAINMLGIATRLGIKMLQASTSEVYGDPLVHPQTEDYFGNVNPIGSRSCYDEGKRCTETLCFDYYRQKGTKVRVARIFNTYGPRMLTNDGRVVSNFIIQALKCDDITIYGDGSQTRSFCFYSDMIEGFLQLMAEDDFTGPVNLGNPHEITVLELAEKIIKLTGSRSKIINKPLPQDDPHRRCPDITMARSKLKWSLVAVWSSVFFFFS